MTISNPHDLGRFPEIEIDTGLAYEFLMTLTAIQDAKVHFEYELGKAWFEQARVRLSPSLRAGIDGFWWTHLLGLAYESAPPRDVQALIAQVESLDAFEIRLYTLGYYERDTHRVIAPEAIRRAADGDKEAQKQFLKASLLEKSPGREIMRRLLALDAETEKQQLLEVLRLGYGEIFCEQEAHILPILQRDAEAKRVLQQTIGPDRFIELATNGMEYIPEPFTRTVLLIPSFVIRPYICEGYYRNIKTFCYPVADESLIEDTAAPPQRLVRLYKALADERRLRMLKKLAVQEYSLQEMADELKVAKTTLHHHFVILRSAGLVLLRTSDHRYRLRKEMLSDVSDLLEGYLRRDDA